MSSLTLHGIGVGPGTGAGPIVHLARGVQTSPNDPVGADPEAEIDRIRAALDAVATDLTQRAGAAAETAAEILATSAELARDPSLLAAAAAHVRAGAPTGHAVTLAVEQFCQQLTALGGYLADRVGDLRDLGRRAVAQLLGRPLAGVPAPGHPFVLAAEDLAPADTAGLGDSEVVALVTAEGGPTSHTAILAKSLGLPAVVACPDSATVPDGTFVVVDAARGTVEITNSATALAAYTRAAAGPVTAGPGRTRDGHPVGLYCNIGTVADAQRAARIDSEGVGLFRTEFVYLERTDSPEFDEQVDTYTEVFTAFTDRPGAGDRPVTVRTLDAGSDKPLPFVDLGREPNPALGMRGLRAATTHPQLLHTQLAALAAAAQQTGTRLRVMAPMVATAAEAREFARTARSFGIAEVGVMIEVPAAALRAAQLMAEIDFVSLGTNDLAQYTFAADRTTAVARRLLDPWQPALLDLIAMVCQAGQQTGTPVGVCGEAASDPLVAALLVGLGVTSLSMAAPMVAAVRDQLAALDRTSCQQAAAAARAAADADTARQSVAALLGGAG